MTLKINVLQVRILISIITCLFFTKSFAGMNFDIKLYSTDAPETHNFYIYFHNNLLIIYINNNRGWC